MSLNILITIILALATVVGAEKKNYDGYEVYKIIPRTRDEVNALSEFQNLGLAEFWDEIFNVNSEIKVMVSPQKRNAFLNRISDMKIQAKVAIKNLQTAIDDQLKPAGKVRRNLNTFLSYDWNSYHDLEHMYKWFDELEANYPNVVTTVVMGKSVEGRDIKGIKINYNPNRDDMPIAMIEGTIHAREWISPATVTWIIKEFLSTSDPEVRSLAENLEWHIFPVVNPDGYSYTFTDNRMWRKNRSKVNSTTCAAGINNDMSNGVDLNRNFDYVWNTEGVSSDPCSNIFPGPTPFSEPEAAAMRDYVTALNRQGNMIYYIAFHSYTQLILVPYSDLLTEDVPQINNFGDMYEVAQRGADALKVRHGTNYRVGLSANLMYKMSGTSFDWVKNATNIPMAFLFELRDLGEYGFLLPSDQIVDNCLEVMDALVKMDRTTRQLGYYSHTNSLIVSVFTLVAGVIFVLMNPYYM